MVAELLIHENISMKSCTRPIHEKFVPQRFGTVRYYNLFVYEWRCKRLKLNIFSIFPQMHRHYPVPPLVRVLDPSSWTMSSALEVKADSWTVPIMELAHITVFTLKMPVSAAILQVCLAEHDGARAVYCVLHELITLFVV